MDQMPSDATMAEDSGTASIDQPREITDAERNTIKALYRRARDHADNELGPKLRAAWRAYDGKVDIQPAYYIGRDESGRETFAGSAAVVREVYDKIRAMLPELARIFLSSDEAVAFDPTRQEDEASAEQATDYSNYVFFKQNEGEELLLDAFIDWSIKFASAKVYWTVEEKEEEQSFSGVSELGLHMLQQQVNDPQANVESIEAEPYEEMIEVQQMQPDGSVVTVPQPSTCYRGKTRINTKKGRIAIDLIPQDEVLIDPDAKKEADALFIGSAGYSTVSDLVALGIPRETVEEKAGTNLRPGNNDSAAQARRGRTNPLIPSSDIGDDSLRYVRRVEALVRLDRDEDGIAERYRVLMLGDEPDVVSIEPGDDCFYVLASPIRRPHEPVGSGIAESVADIQDQLTGLVRGWFNSLNRAGNPREVTRATDVLAYEDLTNPFGGPVRSDNPDDITVHQYPFVGDRNAGLIQYLDARSAGRTGVSLAGQGLDPDVLKGQTVDAAKAVVTAPQTQLEFAAREFAAGFLRPVFLAILKLSKAHQDKPVTVRLRNKWVEVDPSQWSADMDCSVRVGLGGGTKGEKMAALGAIMTKQEMLLQVGSPLADWDHYYNALAQWCELAGYKATQRFFKQPSPEEMQAAAQNAKAQKDQAAQQAIALEAAKAGAVAKAKADGDVAKAQIDAQRAREQSQIDSELAREQAVMQMTLDREKMANELQALQMKLAMEERLKMREFEAERELEILKIKAHSRDGQGNIETVVRN